MVCTGYKAALSLTLLCLSGILATDAALKLPDMVHREAPVIPNVTGTGHCEPATHDAVTGTTNVVCYGPRHLLAPGEAMNIVALFGPSPYPVDQFSLLLNQRTQIVDDDKNPVPLTEVYGHHFASSYKFLGTLGTEMRGVNNPIPAPYGRVINGSQLADAQWRKTNVELVNQVGVREEDRRQCVECWCDPHEAHDPSKFNFAATEVVNGHKVPVSRWGTFLCCRTCPSTLAHLPPKGYRMQYQLTFRPIQPEEHVIPVDMVVMNVAGWPQVEYQIPEALGPNITHVQVLDTTIDANCPKKQAQPVQVVRCQAHQHFGAQCMELIDLTNNHTICRSCPVVGDGAADEPGNEAGYIVHELENDVSPPYTLAPGTPVRIKAMSDASEPRFGLMGLLWTWVAGMSEPCRADPGPDVPAPGDIPIPTQPGLAQASSGGQMAAE